MRAAEREIFLEGKMSDLNGEREMKQCSAGDLRKICLEAGADDAGFVNIDREALQKEREGILKVYN